MTTQHKLYRSRTDRLFAGVCGGISKWLSRWIAIDTTFIRIFFALLVLEYGTGLFFYIALAFIIPTEPYDNHTDYTHTQFNTRQTRKDVTPNDKK